MVWLIAAAGGTGFLLGLWLLRVYLIVASSAALVVLCVAIAPVVEWSLLAGVGFAFALVGALQSGYLGGVLLSYARARAKTSHAILRSSHIDQ